MILTLNMYALTIILLRVKSVRYNFTVYLRTQWLMLSHKEHWFLYLEVTRNICIRQHKNTTKTQPGHEHLAERNLTFVFGLMKMEIRYRP